MKKKLVFIPVFLMGLVLGLTSCLTSDEGSNYNEYRDYIVVVGYDEIYNVPTLNFIEGEVGADILDSQYREKGTCLGRVDFRIDFDKQPSNKYVSATSLLSTPVIIPQFSYQTDPDFSPSELSNNIFPIEELGYMFYSNQLGRIFFTSSISDLYENQNLSYKLVYLPKEGDDEENGSAKDVFLYAEATGEPIGVASSFKEINAYNLNELFRLGSDSIGKSTNIEYRYLRLNLRYYNGMRNDEPQWLYASGSANQTVDLLMYKKDME